MATVFNSFYSSNRYYQIIFVLFFLVFLSEKLYADYNWPHYPSDAEIKNAVSDYLSGENRKTNRTSANYHIVKYHSKRLAQVARSEAGMHSRVLLILEEVYSQFGQTFSELQIYTLTYGRYEIEYNVYSQDTRFQFSQPANFFYNTPYYLKTYESSGELHSDVLSVIGSNPDLELGFAIINSRGESSSTTSPSPSPDYIPDNNNEDYDDGDDGGVWTVIIGALAAVAAGTVVARLRKKRKKKSDEPKKKKKKEKPRYILNINQSKFKLVINEPQELVVEVYKETEGVRKKVNANISIKNPEKALRINPPSGSGDLKSQLLLKELPKLKSFKLIITAVADGYSKTTQVGVETSKEKQIIVEIEPDNKKTLRPNIERVLTCYTKVVDENGKAIQDLTEEIEFIPRSDWLDFSDMVMDEEWKVINIGASDPDANAAVSHPPKSVTLSWVMEKVPEGETALQKDVEIQLLDCKIDTSVDTHDLSFVASKEKTELIFSVFIEDCDDSEPWNFGAAYKTEDDKPDDPVSSISIEKTSDIKAQVTLTGPILLPKEGEQWIRKLLVISGQQDKEEPLERHLYIYVSKVGLYIEEGINKKRELSFIAKGDYEKDIEFGLYKYDPEKEEVVVDEVGLENLSFELLNKKKEDKNLASVLEVDFDLYGLVTNIPRGRYTLHAPVEIPGYGDVTDLVYRAKAPIVEGTENPERFQTDITLKVQSLNTGKRYPTWQEAYDDCKYIIDKYVPAGPPQDKLRAILEQRKVLLDAEGLTELRKKMWSVAYSLILAEGAEGYKDVDAWANYIVETLEWTQWAGDLSFNILMAIYFKKFGAAGALGATGSSMLKELIVEGIVFYAYEKGSFKEFKKQQYQKIVPLLMNVAKGRLISVDNIALCVKNNRPLAWAIFIAVEFAYNLWQTKSMVEAAKNTLRQIRDEYIIGKVTDYVIKNPVKTGLKVAEKPKKVKYESTRVKKTLSKLESKVRKNRIGGKFIDKGDVLEIMKDPAMVRTIKEHGSTALKKAFDGPRKKIYQEHDRNLRHQVAKQEGISPDDLMVDDFRTPGTKGYNLNTDRDYRLLRKHKMANGKEVWLEVPRKKWLNKSYKELGKLTRKPSNMSDQQWAEQLQQRGTDKYDAEACADYSDHAIDPKTGKRIRVKPNVLDVEAGKGTLIDPDDMGRMYKQKVINAGDTPEAFAQAKKGAHTIKSVRKGYEKQGYKLKKLDQKLEKAMRIIENQKVTVDGTPSDLAHTKKLLSDLGYKKGVNQVMNEVSNEFSALKNVSKKSYTERFSNFLFK